MATPGLLATNLKHYRAKSGLSLKQLAVAVGVSKGHLWDLESDRSRNPSLETLRGLSNTLCVPIKVLVGESTASDEDTLCILEREIRSLCSADQQLVGTLIKNLKSQKEARA